MNSIRSNRWYYYHDGSNTSEFKRLVIGFLNKTTVSRNEPYKGEKSPRYYGMVDGEPFMRKTKDDFIKWGCTLYSLSDFQETTSSESNLITGQISTIHDLKTKSWCVSYPTHLIINFLNKIGNKNYSGRGSYYGIVVKAGNSPKVFCKSKSYVDSRNIPILKPTVVDSILQQTEHPKNPSESFREVEQAKSKIDAEILAKNIEARVKAESELAETRRKLAILQMERSITITKKESLLKEQELGSSNRIMTSPMEKPILLKKRRRN